MKKIVIGAIMASSLVFGADLKPLSLDTYLKSFDLKSRKDMKASSADMLNMLKEGTAVLIDIRFREEFEAWNFPFAKNIPLHELPDRLGELPKDKIIITACPHNDRANLARIYLLSKGYNAKYLNDGLLKVADALRGDNAFKFIQELKKSN